MRSGKFASVGATVFSFLMNREDSANWLIWQLSDSAFPTGGFAHSSGLEAAWQQQEVRGRVELASFLEASLEQLGRTSLPFVMAAHRDAARLADLDQLCDAFTTSHIANRASRLQGRAMLASSERIFATPSLQPPCGHLAPVFGALTRLLEIGPDSAGQLYFFCHLRGLTASSVRLGIVGPMEAQALQHRLSLRAQEIFARHKKLNVNEVAQTAPLLELWQGAQDRLYSRIFQS
jgi:urease accessory protein